eukprot:79830-Amorphochlora_amoeboformis.AAC.2
MARRRQGQCRAAKFVIIKYSFGQHVFAKRNASTSRLRQIMQQRRSTPTARARDFGVMTVTQVQRLVEENRLLRLEVARLRRVLFEKVREHCWPRSFCDVMALIRDASFSSRARRAACRGVKVYQPVGTAYSNLVNVSTCILLQNTMEDVCEPLGSVFRTSRLTGRNDTTRFRTLRYSP